MKKLIFVYGTLKKGFGNHRVMGDSKLLGEVNIKGFRMYSLGGYPALTLGNNEIKGEVYEVTDENTLKNIYRLEGYSGVRDSSSNWYDTTDVDTKYGKAELFYMKNENEFNNRPVVTDGIWKQSRNW